jgi:prefoldin subunit 5
MVDKVELNGFLNELISILKKKFEVYDGNIKSMREDIRKLSASKDDSSINELKNKVRILENTINSMRARTQVDTSLLKELESGESERRH